MSELDSETASGSRPPAVGLSADALAIKASEASGPSGAAAEAHPCPATLCGFWLGKDRFGIDVSLVGEVVHLDEVTPVPQSHAALRGIFNLRGVPVALVELGYLLEQEFPAPDSSRRGSAVVLRRGSVVAGFPVDRIDAVVQASSGRFVAARQGSEQALVLGFLELPGQTGQALTVLDSETLIARIALLRYGTNSSA